MSDTNGGLIARVYLTEMYKGVADQAARFMRRRDLGMSADHTNDDAVFADRIVINHTQEGGT